MAHHNIEILKQRRSERSADQFVLWKELDLIIDLLEVNMEGIAQTEAALEQLKKDSEARDVATKSALDNLKAEISTLSAQGVDTTAVNASINALDAAVKTGTTEAQTADPGAAPVKPSVPTQPVYEFTQSEGVVEDPANFKVSGFQSVAGEGGTPPSKPLYYYSGDTAGQPAASSNPVPGYTQFAGAVEPVPAA